MTPASIAAARIEGSLDRGMRQCVTMRARSPLWRLVVMSIAFVVCAAKAADAGATTYRCEADGRVAYSDLPCDTGKSIVVGKEVPNPSAEDRADALHRARDDKANLDTIARERRQDERAAALAQRRGTDPGKHIRACDKLAKAARKAHDDYALAGPRDQPRDRLRMQRADEDYAALCKTKR